MDLEDGIDSRMKKEEEKKWKKLAEIDSIGKRYGRYRRRMFENV